VLSKSFNEIQILIKNQEYAKAKHKLLALNNAELMPKGRALAQALLEQCEEKLRAAQNQITRTESSLIIGEYNTYPTSNVERLAEGGKRVNIKNYKRTSTTEKPLISILTVVYNNAKTVEKCIQSVLSQTYDNIEYIIVDGASTDGTLDIIRRYEEQLDYFVSEKDGGIYNAMNKALSLAKGDYIACLNADDFYLQQAVEMSVNHILKNDLQLSYAGFYYADENGIAVVADEAKEWDESMMIQGVPGGHETLFLHKDCYQELGGYDESYKLAADYHLFIRAFKAGFKGAPLNRNILVMMPGGASFNESVELDENFRILDFCFEGLTKEFREFLYGLKYYKNWHGYTQDDKAIMHYLAEASKYSEELEKALFLTLEQRKRELKGKIKPAEKKYSTKLKICIALNYLSDASGGAERIAIESANKLHEEGHAVTVVQCFGKASEPYYLLNPEIPQIDLGIFPYKNQYLMPAEGIDISYERFGGRKFDDLDFEPTKEDFIMWEESHHFWRSQIYAGFFHHHHFDVVISHMPSTYPYVLLPKSRKDKTLHIASLHSAPGFKFYSPLYPAESKMERYMRLVALEQTDRISVLFNEFIDQVPKKFQDKCFVLPNFLSSAIDNFASIENTQDINRHDKKTVISIGRLSKEKDHKTLIKAFARVKEKHSSWSLKIFGEGSLKNSLSQLCQEQGLDSKEVLQGARKDIQEAYKLGSIFALPSLFEGFGLTALEAMRFGIPIIAFKSCEGVRNLITHEKSGLQIDDTERVRSMSHALNRLISDTELSNRLGKTAASEAKQYSVNAYTRTLLAVIDEWYSSHNYRPIPATTDDLEKKLRYAILTTYTEGGAGIASVRLANALRKQGIDVSIISLSKGDSRYDFKVSLNQEQQKLYNKSQELSKKHTKPGSTYFANMAYPSLTNEQLSFLKFFDVINLHWIQILLNTQAINYVSKLGPKVIWTLHDMAPMTGGCHYSDDCLQFTKSCDDCPQLEKNMRHIPKENFEEKLKLWDNSINIVSPSQWLADCAAESRLFKNNPITVIPNSVNLEIFVPTGKHRAREFWGVPQDKIILLFTCGNHGERRKGFKEMLEASHILAEECPNKYHVIMFGRESEETKLIPLPYTALGHISEEWKLAVGYSAADITILPTLEDNLPNTILESSACGTPVIAFDSGGVSDAVIDGINGKLVERTNSKALSQAILNFNLESSSSSSICIAHNKWNAVKQADRYLNLI
tara:strand:+ start:1899 stop:5564 length:3666 start_codon:yes stop_codon:yes gene_type:complete